MKSESGREGLKEELNAHNAKILSEDGGVISIDARGGVQIGEVLSPGDERKRVVRFSKAEGDYVDPLIYGFIVKLGIGLEIQFHPLEKTGDL